jgi:hypothetical protein
MTCATSRLRFGRCVRGYHHESPTEEFLAIPLAIFKDVGGDRVPAVYLTSAIRAILAILALFRISKLRVINRAA